MTWTRAPRDDGSLATIQEWFAAAGFEPRALVVGEGDLFGVGVARFRGPTAEVRPGVRLFGAFVR